MSFTGHVVEGLVTSLWHYEKSVELLAGRAKWEKVMTLGMCPPKEHWDPDLFLSPSLLSQPPRINQFGFTLMLPSPWTYGPHLPKS